jgi:hypothetical protein
MAQIAGHLSTRLPVRHVSVAVLLNEADVAYVHRIGQDDCGLVGLGGVLSAGSVRRKTSTPEWLLSAVSQVGGERCPHTQQLYEEV